MWFWNAENVEKVYHCMDATRQQGICGEPRHALSFRLRDECVNDNQKCRICKYLENIHFEEEHHYDER